MYYNNYYFSRGYRPSYNLNFARGHYPRVVVYNFATGAWQGTVHPEADAAEHLRNIIDKEGVDVSNKQALRSAMRKAEGLAAKDSILPQIVASPLTVPGKVIEASAPIVGGVPGAAAGVILDGATLGPAGELVGFLSGAGSPAIGAGKLGYQAGRGLVRAIGRGVQAAGEAGPAALVEHVQDKFRRSGTKKAAISAVNKQRAANAVRRAEARRKAAKPGIFGAIRSWFGV